MIKKPMSVKYTRKWPIFVLVLVGVMAMLRPLIVAPGPLVYKKEGTWRVFASSPNCNAEKVLLQPIWQKDPALVNIKHRLLPPMSKEEESGEIFWLGTDHLGRDVLAALMYGVQMAFFIGLGATILSLLIGVLLGFVAGWYENNGWRLSRTTGYMYMVATLLWIPITAFTWQNTQGTDFWIGVFGWLSISLLLFIGVYFLNKRENNIPIATKKIYFPWDNAINQLVTFMGSVPMLILIMILTSFFWQQTPLRLILVIGLLRWPAIARYTRAEVLKLKNKPYVLLANNRYASKWRLWWREFRPHLYTPLLGFMAYSIASTVSMETSLSFLGLGLRAETPTWGALIGSSLYYSYAWWIYTFPIALLAFLLISLHMAGDDMLKKSSIQGRLLRW